MRGGCLEPGYAARRMARHTTDHTRLTILRYSEVQLATARRPSLVGTESPLRRVIKQCADTRSITGHGGSSSDSSDFTDSTGPTPPRLRTGRSFGSLRNVGADVTLMELDQPSTLNLHRTHTLTCTLALRPRLLHVMAAMTVTCHGRREETITDGYARLHTVT